MNIKVGDVVTLKSGGPDMTVSEIKDDQAFCVWFKGEDACHMPFNLEVLEPAEDDGPVMPMRG